ncbi:hypothetical protein [Paraferrimonas sedimenticola]|uniref:Uncharacterized protein n=1 Tax=Paraferrimonas sedimenticola TaxID=375674 RepID=A0AA37W189_9GAMM|nr:hypothetical protein [Paraferrimonas sedimenticola]GLP96027.1 hypothetical protein GCM10007895_13330 [Paraferrimonas sedimenticola]
MAISNKYSSTITASILLLLSNGALAFDSKELGTVFNGESSYGEMPAMSAYGGFEIRAKFSDFSPDNARGWVTLVSESRTKRSIMFDKDTVVVKLGKNSFTISKKDLDFMANGQIAIGIYPGELTASDGVVEYSIENSKIQPNKAQFDRLFRRGNYSGGFSGVVMTQFSLDGKVEQEVYHTSPGLESELPENSGNLTLHEVVVNRPAIEIKPPIEVEKPEPKPPVDQPKAPGQPGYGAVFNGEDAYAEFADWQAQGDIQVRAWLGELTAKADGSYDWLHLLSNAANGQSLRVNNGSVQMQFDRSYPGVYGGLDFASKRFVEVTISAGKLTVSDGDVQKEIANEAIHPSKVTFNRAYFRNGKKYPGILQALEIVDLGQSTNRLAFNAEGFDLVEPAKQGIELVNVEMRVPEQSKPPITQPPEVTPPDTKPPVVNPPPTPENPDKLDLSNSQVKTQQDWDDAFNTMYPAHKPVMNIDVGDDTGRFAWEAPVWLKAYVTMAETFNDPKYIEWAVELVDHLFNYTDEMRAARGEINLVEDGYWQAPKYYMNNYGQPVPGWRHYNPRNGKNWRVQALQDGRILSGVMVVVDYIKRHQIESLMDKANGYMAHAKRIVDSHDTSYSETKQSDVAGSYYYPNSNSETNDNGLSSRPIPFNHNLSQAFVQMYLDKWSDGEPVYHHRVQALTTFFSDKLEYQSDGSCTWRYQHHSQNPDTKAEDLNHGDIDIEFVAAAYAEGVISDDLMMRCITKTFTERMYQDKSYSDLVDGTGVAKGAHQVNSGWHWVRLTQFDKRVQQNVLDTMNQHAPTLTWYGTYLSWANMLKLAQ